MYIMKLRLLYLIKKKVTLLWVTVKRLNDVIYLLFYNKGRIFWNVFFLIDTFCLILFMKTHYSMCPSTHMFIKTYKGGEKKVKKGWRRWTHIKNNYQYTIFTTIL